MTCNALVNPLLGSNEPYSLFVRGFKKYRQPKRIHHERRPEAPPFLGQMGQYKRQIEELQQLPDEERSQLIEGLDFPLSVGPARPNLISCSDQIFDGYKPPSNETSLSGKLSHSVTNLVSVADQRALRRMRKSMGDFDRQAFLEQATHVYKQLFTQLTKVPMGREGDFMPFCTERCYPILMEGLLGCQVKWHYLETVEPARIVHARINSFIQDDHEFGQITVRMHSRQILAIYDRFGRLLKGDPENGTSVVQYVVFERHMRPMDWGSEWRVHGKIDQQGAGAGAGREAQSESTYNVNTDFRTTIVPGSWKPSFPRVAPVAEVDPERWNEKWSDSELYYDWSEQEEQDLKARKTRMRNRHTMHPAMRL